MFPTHLLSLSLFPPLSVSSRVRLRVFFKQEDGGVEGMEGMGGWGIILPASAIRL